MTTWRDFKVNPMENNGPPPSGSPENVPTNQINNIQREVMSVIRQLGDEKEADIDALGTMAMQDADAVAITGGSMDGFHSGNGAGLQALRAQQLIEGPIPASVFPLDPPLDVKVARAAQADGMAPTGWDRMLPIGTILMFWNWAPIPAGWALCDGTNGTPNLVGRLIMAAGPGVALGQQGGQWSVSVATDGQGSHSHGGATQGHALTVAEMPSHGHTHNMWSGAGGSIRGPVPTFDGSAGTVGNVDIMPTGGGAAHGHGLWPDGNHAHNVTVPTQPPYTAVNFIMRIS